MQHLNRWGIAIFLLAAPLTLHAGDWAQWRGANRDGHAAPDEQFPAVLPKEPGIVWQKNIGGGFSSPVIKAGRLAYLDALEGKEVAHLLDAKTGKELWRTPFADQFEDEWGPGPRSTPIFDDDVVYVQSCNGEFRCLNLADGKPIWGTSFEKDFGVHFVGSKANEGTASRRGNNGCGIIDGSRIYLPVGAVNGASLVCFEKKTGKLLWKSQNEEAAYSSLVAATIAGTRQVIYFAADSLMGVAADSGKLLWRVPLVTNAKRHAATPIVLGDSVIVNSHTFGLLCFGIQKTGAEFKAEQRWANKQMKINISTPVLVDHWLYSQGPGRELVCVDALTGKTAWSQDGFGEKNSSVIAAGNRLLVVTDRGELILAAADAAAYRQLGRLQVSGKTWNHPAWADGKLYVREGLTSGWKLSCLDLSGPVP
jgi:outer membrane protein assembly factor BamB